VYANVFPVARKTAIALYNNNDSAFRGPVLRVEPRVGRHYVDVLLDRAVAVVADPGGAALAAELPAMDVTCIAELPAILELRPQAERVVVELRERVHQPTLRYVWDDDQPTRAVALPLVRGRAEVPLSAERAGRKLIVKLYAGVYLADEAVWPEN
jgi:hypothetical protein